LFENLRKYSQFKVHLRYQIVDGINDTGGKFCHQFRYSVVDTGGKFATSVNDTGGNFPPVSTTLLLTLVANNGNTIRLLRP
jgi:hypothetical protein